MAVSLCTEWAPAAWHHCPLAPAWLGALPAPASFMLYFGHDFCFSSCSFPSHSTLEEAGNERASEQVSGGGEGGPVFRQVRRTTFWSWMLRQSHLVVMSTGSAVGCGCVPGQFVSLLSLTVKWV